MSLQGLWGAPLPGGVSREGGPAPFQQFPTPHGWTRAPQLLCSPVQNIPGISPMACFLSGKRYSPDSRENTFSTYTADSPLSSLCQVPSLVP